MKDTGVAHAVVLARGSPTHRSQLIYNRPRAMLPALGKPLIARSMNRLVQAGIHNFTVIVGNDEGGAAAFLDSRWLPNVEINFIVQAERETLAHTLVGATDAITAPFLLTTYNSFAHLHFAARLLKQGESSDADLVLSGGKTPLSSANSHIIAHVDGTAVTRIDRETAGQGDSLYLMDMALCGEGFMHFLRGWLDDGSSALREPLHLYGAYLAAENPTAIVDSAWTLHIETDADLLTLHTHLLDEEQDAHILSELPGTVQIIPPVRIDPQVSVGQHARIGPYVYLESGCSIGQGAVVSHALILQKAVVAPGAEITHSIVSSRSTIQVG